MADLVQAGSTPTAEYERLLLERDALRKEANGCFVSYLQKFGAQINAVFNAKIDCISKKKSIAFCQASVNRGEPINANALQTYLADTMAEYNAQLKQMVQDYETCRDAKTVTEGTVLQVKNLYRKIAKQIHPDMNPALADAPIFAELWVQVSAAYQGNDLEALQELEVLVNRALQDSGFDTAKLVIPDLATRIGKLQAEIESIKTTDPYQYKFWLNDEAVVEEKKQELQSELEEFTSYGQELAKVLQGFLGNGVVVQWPET